MCASCAVTAAAAATGARSWLQARGGLSRRALRRATVGICVVAFGVASVGVSGSSAAPDRPAAPPAAGAR